ncbi:potassium channel family protein [Kitasatospora herbaricolor]|uniref:potassium channel family protein n=1 Tax=Kitasatospora herbaricolor TaxID=68217 RepID=UPI0036DE43BA
MSSALLAVYYLLPLDSGFSVGTVLALAGGIAAVAVLLAWQSRVIVRSPWPVLRGVEALATALPLLLVLFSAVYYLLERSVPESFSEPLSRSDALYFSMTVFSTVGFGDISGRSGPARLLVTGQMAVDLLLIGVAARLLVGAVQEGVRRRGRVSGGVGPSAP